MLNGLNACRLVDYGCMNINSLVGRGRRSDSHTESGLRSGVQLVARARPAERTPFTRQDSLVRPRAQQHGTVVGLTLWKQSTVPPPHVCSSRVAVGSAW
jgi:hypothetical protein